MFLADQLDSFREKQANSFGQGWYDNILTTSVAIAYENIKLDNKT